MILGTRKENKQTSDAILGKLFNLHSYLNNPQKDGNIMKELMITSIAFFMVLYAQSLIAEPFEMTLAFENKESFPYYMGDGSKLVLNKPGSSVEIIQLVAKELGIKIYWKRMPWKRCLLLMRENSIDGTFNASFKKERLKFGVYPSKNGKIDPERRLLTVHYSFYKRKDSPIEWDGKKFINFKGEIGVVLGYSVEKDLKEKGFPVDSTLNTLANLKKLIYGRIDLIVGSRTQIESFIRNNYKAFKNVIELKVPLKVKPSYLMLSHKFVKENPDKSDKIWDTIRKIRNTEVVQKIYDKYN